MSRPSVESKTCEVCEADDNNESSLACDPSERRRGVQTPRSGLSLVFVRLSCFSVWITGKSLLATLSLGTPFLSFWNNCILGARGGFLSLSWFEVWISNSDCGRAGGWFWWESAFRRMLLMILPPASRLWFCLKGAEFCTILAGLPAFCCSGEPPETYRIRKRRNYLSFSPFSLCIN